MLKKSRYYILSLSLVIPVKSLSFDKLICDSSLKNWSVHANEKKNSVVMNRTIPTTSLSREKSLLLLIHDENLKEVAYVSPWNGIQYYKTKSSIRDKNIYSFKTDSETWFDLEIKSPRTKHNYAISCHLSF